MICVLYLLCYCVAFCRRSLENRPARLDLNTSQTFNKYKWAHKHDHPLSEGSNYTNSGSGLCVNVRPCWHDSSFKLLTRVCLLQLLTFIFSQNHLYVGHSWEDLFDGSTFVYLWSGMRMNKAAHISIVCVWRHPVATCEHNLINSWFNPSFSSNSSGFTIKLNLTSPSNPNKHGFITKEQHW